MLLAIALAGPGGLPGECGVNGAELGQGVSVQVALAERDRHTGGVLPLGEQHPVWPERGDGEGVLAVEDGPWAHPAKPAQLEARTGDLDS